MAVAHAFKSNEAGLDLVKIPHDDLPFIYPQVGFGEVHIIGETEQNTFIIMVSGDGKGSVKEVYQKEGELFLTTELETVEQGDKLEQESQFLYRRLRDITRENVQNLLKSDAETDTLMDNLKNPAALIAFYTDHILENFEDKLRVFAENDLNRKLQLLGNYMVTKSLYKH